MKFFQIVADLHRQVKQERIRKAAVAGAMLIGMLFALLSVYAFWNPVKHMENLEVPVVVLDQGTEFEGETTNFGEQVAEKVVENKNVSWKIYHRNIFENGIENTNYFFGFIIPKDFSQQIIEGKSNPENKVNITFLMDARKNFLMSQMSGNIRTAFSDAIAHSISEKYAIELCDGLDAAADGMSDAADGSQVITEGLDKTRTGAQKLYDGVSSLENGASNLSDGLSALHEGSEKLESGVSNMASGVNTLYRKMSELSSGIKTLEINAQKAVDGASDLSKNADRMSQSMQTLTDGISTARDSSDTAMQNYADGLSAYASGYKSLYEAVESSGLLASLPEEQQQVMAALYNQSDSLTEGFESLQVGIDAGFDQLSTSSEQLQSGAESLATGANSLSDGISSLYKGLQTAEEGTSQFEDGMNRLNSSTPQLNTGAKALNNGVESALSGADRLTSGSNKLATGTQTLLEGQDALLEGSNSLTEALQDGQEEIKTALDNDSEQLSVFISDPLNTERDIYGETSKYGLGMSPLFLSLGLWIGSLILFFAVPLRPRRKLASPGIVASLGSYSAFLVYDLLVAVAISLGAIFIVGIVPKSILFFFLWAILCGAVFLSILHMLHVTLGELPGKAVGILFIVFQIATSGGAIAPQLEPAWLQTISPLFPMYYSIDGFREIIFGGDFNNMTYDLIPLACWLTASLIISSLCWTRKVDKSV